MIELSYETISEQAEKNSEQYVDRFRKVAKVAFEEGALWLAAELGAIVKEEKK